MIIQWTTSRYYLHTSFNWKRCNPNRYRKMQAAIEETAESAEKFSHKTISNKRPAANKPKETKCQTTNLLVKPLRLRNIDGNWRVIVQDAHDIFQREEVAICTRLNVPCQTNKKSSEERCHQNRRCRQKFSIRKLLAFDPCNPDRGVFVETFKLQSACDCRL